jgi:hypothetical protein
MASSKRLNIGVMSGTSRLTMPRVPTFTNVPTQHRRVLVPGLLHNDPFAHPCHRRGCHEPNTETVAAIVRRIDLNRGEGAFDRPRHAQTTQGTRSRMTPAIYWPEERSGGDTSQASKAHSGQVASLVPIGMPLVKLAPS